MHYLLPALQEGCDPAKSYLSWFPTVRSYDCLIGQFLAIIDVKESKFNA